MCSICILLPVLVAELLADGHDVSHVISFNPIYILNQGWQNRNVAQSRVILLVHSTIPMTTTLLSIRAYISPFSMHRPFSQVEFMQYGTQ